MVLFVIHCYKCGLKVSSIRIEYCSQTLNNGGFTLNHINATQDWLGVYCVPAQAKNVACMVAHGCLATTRNCYHSVQHFPHELVCGILLWFYAITAKHDLHKTNISQ